LSQILLIFIQSRWFLDVFIRYRGGRVCCDVIIRRIGGRFVVM
jgi:hypothetical protein